MKNPTLSPPKGAFVDLKLEISLADRRAIEALSVLAHQLTGVQLSERHQSMVMSRLSKRIGELQLASVADYLEYFHAHKVQETPKLVGLLTTHHTYFFREFSHFEFLRTVALPNLSPILKARPDKKLKVWVAACSRGQEAYSLAMFLDFHLKQIDGGLNYEILGTDIDAESVDIARNGVYARSDLKEVPLNFVADHWARGTGEIDAFVKAKKSLRDHCRFKVANLLDLGSLSQNPGGFDLIFCRNVFIYFNSEQIQGISKDLLSRLSPDGYFFIGVSESLSGLNLPVSSLGPSVYKHKLKSSTNPPIATVASVRPGQQPQLLQAPDPRIAAVAAAVQPPKPIRVLCVDDSPSILTLMKQILSSASGFEVVGIAKNGIEASRQVAALKPDALTLDIHMPEQTGIEYLEKNFKAGHPPVVMVTSVSREDADLAGKALSLGAADYVEKPAFSNLAERGEEIRMKLRCALLPAAAPADVNLKLDRAFQAKRVLTDVQGKLQVIVMQMSGREKLKKLMHECSGPRPATIILIEGAKQILPALSKTLSQDLSRQVAFSDEVPASLHANDLILLDLPSCAQKLQSMHGKAQDTSVLVFGDVSAAGSQALGCFRGAQVVLEDLGSGVGSKNLMGLATDVVVSTSFAYLSDGYLSGKKAA